MPLDEILKFVNGSPDGIVDINRLDTRHPFEQSDARHRQPERVHGLLVMFVIAQGTRLSNALAAHRSPSVLVCRRRLA